MTWGDLDILRKIEQYSSGQPSDGGVLIADAGRNG